ncbi:hypothetical protein SETIT_4G137500v2 [Setaria italica]|uniref:Jasmonate O-methyltransferase n=1 Tax=Setaria italica TaxID=4555 RepID=A0A368QTX0_SETIT|nr:hypothetical protein SETIT_4G137500v2 [Setaria italica]
MKHTVEEAVTDLMSKYTNTISSMVITDLGCSSGPNAVSLVSMAVDAIFCYCALDQKVPPELCVLLNDLPGNDFNNVAKRLVAFQKNARSSGPVLTAIVPGSFYKMVFNSSSVHLAFASSSVQWLSEGAVGREKLDSFYIPMYGPSDKELREIVEDQSSFSINKIQVHDVISDVEKGSIKPKMMDLAARAAYEPIIVEHFGSQAAVVEEFERTVEWHVRAGTPQVALCVSQKEGLVTTLFRAVYVIIMLWLSRLTI